LAESRDKNRVVEQLATTSEDALMHRIHPSKQNHSRVLLVLFFHAGGRSFLVQ
jgi:hypothetical protein